MQASSDNRFPAIDAATAEHSDACAAYIRERIAEADGSLSFAEFMHHALYAPGLGYYTAGARKFGSAGDFVTAPEVSRLFGYIVARQCAHVLEHVNDGSILELGAGSGRLAVDVLVKLRELDRLPARYRILEVSPDLAERQRDLITTEIPDLSDRVSWLDRLPDGHRGVVLANEVLDALPVERFVRRDTIRQIRVGDAGDRFEFVEADAPEPLVAAVEGLEAELGQALQQGYASEVSLGMGGLVSDVVGALDDGVALFFDYGLGRRELYAPDRSSGSLRCHFRQHAHDDPLILPGAQDITAWVDFTAAASAGVDAGASVAFYLHQASFLMLGGMQAEMREWADADPLERLELSRQFKVLTMPGEMGERFKCLGLTRGSAPAFPVYHPADRTHTL